MLKLGCFAWAPSLLPAQKESSQVRLLGTSPCSLLRQLGGGGRNILELQPAALFCEQPAASLHHILLSCAQAEREGRVGSSSPGKKKMKLVCAQIHKHREGW